MALSVTRRAFTTGLAGALFASSTGDGAEPDPVRIRDVARAHGFRFGAAAVVGNLSKPKLRQLLEAECDLITTENAMKMKIVRPEEYQLQFDRADELVSWAGCFGASVRGHTLVFTSSMPEWLNGLKEKSETKAIDAVLDYVTMMAHGYRDRVVSLDVVNEAISKEDRGDGKLPYLKQHWLYEIGGIDVIADAFVRAKEAAPNVELVYNDWILPYPGALHRHRQASLLALLEELDKRNAPVDTIGIQSHLTHDVSRVGTDSFDADDWQAFLGEIERSGHRIAITELSATDACINGTPQERDIVMARAVEEYLGATLEARTISDIICWGISDLHTHHNDKDRDPERDCEKKTKGRFRRALPYKGGDPEDDDGELTQKPMADVIMQAMRAAPARKPQDSSAALPAPLCGARPDRI